MKNNIDNISNAIELDNYVDVQFYSINPINIHNYTGNKINYWIIYFFSFNFSAISLLSKYVNGHPVMIIIINKIIK